MSRSLQLIHISGELPPTVGGIADYTSILTQRITEVSGRSITPTLVLAGRRTADTIETMFPAEDLSGQCSASELATTVTQLGQDWEGSSVVLLEYSGYGYAQRGAPLWLYRGLRSACKEGDVPLLMMAHELYATGPPWTSAFWMSPLQRAVVAGLARLSDGIATNRVLSAQWLRRYAKGDTPVRVQPVFSNVGEPEHIPSFEERSPHAVVFGGGAMKNRLYETLQHTQGHLLEELEIDRIVDLGATDELPDSVAGIPVEGHGIQPASVISTQLQQARIGLLQYPVDYLTKSGIWASYAAHGLPSLVVSAPASSDPLEENCHFLRVSPDDVLSETPDLEEVGDQAQRWYQATAHSKQAAQTFSKLISIYT